MTLWKKISLGVLIFVLVLVGAVGFLVGTTTGLHLLFNAANRWVPGLEIGQVTGGWRDLTLKKVRYTQPGVAVDAGEFHGESLRRIWLSVIAIRRSAPAGKHHCRANMPRSSGSSSRSEAPLPLLS